MRIKKFTAEKLYLSILGLYVIVEILDSSLLDISQFDRLFNLAVLILLAIVFFTNAYNRVLSSREIILSLSVLLLFSISSYTSSKLSLVINGAFIICAGKTPFRKICKVHLAANITAFIIIAFFLLIGIIKDYKIIDAHCFGFNYFHHVPYHFYFCFLEYLFLKKHKMKTIETIIWIILNIIIYKYSTVLLVFILVFVSIFFYYLIKKYSILNINKKNMIKASYIVFPLGAFITLFIMVFYNTANPIWQALNAFSSGRLKLMHTGYLSYPITLFGQRIINNTGVVSFLDSGYLIRQRIGAYFYIDSGFAYAILGYGLLITIFMLLLYSMLCVHSCRTNNKVLFIWLVSLMLFTISNNVWLSVSYSPLMLMALSTFRQINMSHKKIFRISDGIIMQRGHNANATKY